MNIHYFCDLQARVTETSEISITVCLNVGQIFHVDFILSDGRTQCKTLVLLFLAPKLHETLESIYFERV